MELGRPLRPAVADAGRHRRRLSRRRRRGSAARPEAIARSTSRLPGAERARLSRWSSARAARAAPSPLPTADRVYMLEHAIYSVISPEGAASILWRDTTRSRDAATSMKITAQDLLDMKIIDGIVAGTDRRRAPLAGRGDRGHRRGDRQGVFGFRRLEHGFPRASAREVSGDRPQPVKIRPHFATNSPPRFPSMIGTDGTIG